MWIMIWLLVTLFIVVVSAWSYSILLQQKKAWKAFAEKHKFTYTPNKMMESPYMRGRLDELIINMYSDKQATEDMRGFRYVSVVEVELGGGVPVKAAIGTEKNKALVNELSLTKDVVPDHEKWSKDYIARTSNKRRFKTYFTQERLDTLMALFSMKSTTVLFFCDELDAVLRIETSDPMRDPEKMERIMKRLIRDMKVLSPTAAESADLPKSKSDDEDDDDTDIPPVLSQDVDLDDIGLELEDDEDGDAAVVPVVAASEVKEQKKEKPAAKKAAAKPAKKPAAKKAKTKKESGKSDK